MKGLFGGQAHDDANLHLKNFINMCFPFDIAHISKKIKLFVSLSILFDGRNDLIVAIFACVIYHPMGWAHRIILRFVLLSFLDVSSKG